MVIMLHYKILTRFFGIFVSFLFSSMAYAEQMDLGLINPQQYDVFTAERFMQATFFVTAMTFLIHYSCYKNKIEKMVLLQIGAIGLYTVLLPVSYIPTTFISFDHFTSVTVLLSAVILLTGTYIIMHQLSEKYKLQESFLIGALSTIMLSFILLTWGIPDLSRNYLNIFWLTTIIIMGAGLFYTIIKKKNNPYVSAMFLSNAGLYMASTITDPTTLTAFTLRNIGWVMCFSAYTYLIYVFRNHCKNINETLNDPLIENDKILSATKEQKQTASFFFEYDSADQMIMLSDEMALILDISGPKRYYPVEHFKKLLVATDQNIFENICREPVQHSKETFSFINHATVYRLQPVCDVTRDLRFIKFKMIATEEEKKRQYHISKPLEIEGKTKASSDQLLNQPSSERLFEQDNLQNHDFLSQFLFNIKKKAVQLKSEEGHIYLMMLHIKNYDLLLYESSVQEAHKTYSAILSAIKDSLKPLKVSIAHELPYGFVGVFLYTPIGVKQFEQIKANILSQMQYPFLSSLGNFFPQINIGYASDYAEKILYDPSLSLIDTLYDKAYKKMISDQIQQCDYIHIDTNDADKKENITMTSLIDAFKYAPENHQIDIYYMPIHNAKENNIIGFNPCIYWNHPDHGIIKQKDVMILAQYTAYHSVLFKILCIKSFERLSVWKAQYQVPFYLNLPISKGLFLEHIDNMVYLVNEIKMMLQEFNLSAQHIYCSFPSSLSKNYQESFADLVQLLKKQGFKIALSCKDLSHIHFSDLSILPIDRIEFTELTQDYFNNERQYYIFYSIIKIMHNLHLKTDITLAEDMDINSALTHLNIHSIAYNTDTHILSSGGMDHHLSKSITKKAV